MNDETLKQLAASLGFDDRFPLDDDLDKSWSQLNAMIDQFVPNENKRDRIKLKISTFFNTYAYNLAKTLSEPLKENEDGNS